MTPKSEWGPESLEAMDGPSRDDLNRFAERVAVAKETNPDPKALPEIEVPRRVINHFNLRSMKGFDEAGYFVYNGVKVFETGKLEAIRARDSLTMEQKLFQK